MKLKYAIKHGPIHIGKLVWKKESNYNLNGTIYYEYCLSTGYSLVYFLLRSGIELEDRYFFFQYAENENTNNVRFIGTKRDFEFIELEYMDMDEMMRFGYFYSPTKAIIKPNFGIQQFYYYISGEFIFGSSEDLYGYFNKNEELLLHELYNTKPLF